ncbi:MAG: wax ester/triacylglycerol synthase domain-containing protein [Halioglobus sp.]
MDDLGLFDQLFYKADQYNVLSAVMGGASILEPAGSDSPLNGEAIAGHLANRMGRIPLLRNKFIQDPLLLGTVRKVEDPDFDIWDHIFIETLPAPGNYLQLSQRLAQLSATPLALSQMWHWTVIEGLEGGKLAVMCNIHHAIADGVGMVEALNSIYDISPVAPEEPDFSVREVQPVPGKLRLLRHALIESGERVLIKTPRFLLKNTGPILGALGKGVKDKLAADKDTGNKPMMPDVGLTSLNINAYSDHRTLSWKTLPLPLIKKLAKRFGVTVNDVGLLLYSYAMEHYFTQTGEDIDFDLWCGMPVSTRDDNSTTGGNKVTVGRICLHNTISDPIQRLAAIHADAQEIKHAKRPETPIVDAEELASLLFPIAIDATMFLAGKLDLMGRFGNSLLLANGLFSNVPGPRLPVYVANGRMAESIPMIPAVNILAVSGGITSVDQSITIGFLCDGAVVENPDLFVQGIDYCMKGLSKASAGKNKVAANARPRKRASIKAKARTKTRARKAGAV